MNNPVFQTKAIEKIKTQNLCSVTLFETHTVYDILWKNLIERGSPQMTICYKCNAFWIPKATSTHSDCVILTTLPLQKWLYERASVLNYTYSACLFNLAGLKQVFTQLKHNVSYVRVYHLL